MYILKIMTIHVYSKDNGNFTKMQESNIGMITECWKDNELYINVTKNQFNNLYCYIYYVST